MNDYGDGFAALYEQYFNGWIRLFSPGLIDYLRTLNPPGSRILDLCCGTGETSAHLCAAGWTVVGLDRSPAMLSIAREKLKTHLADGSAQLLFGNAEDFTLEHPVAACICIDGALNHLESPTALRSCFSHISDVLEEGAPFVFDMLEPDHFANWEAMSLVDDDQAMYVRHGSWDPVRNIAQLHISGALGGGLACWRVRETLVSRAFSGDEIHQALEDAGLVEVPCLLEDPRGPNRTIRCAINHRQRLGLPHGRSSGFAT